MTDDLGLRVLDHGAILRTDRLDHIGLYQVTAIDDGRKASNHLEGGDVESLAEGGYRQVSGNHVFPLPDHALALSRQVNACFFLHAEGLEIVVEQIDAQPLTDGDEGGVAGVAHRLRQGLGTVASDLRTVNRVIGDLHAAGAVKGVALTHHPLLQGGGQHQGFEGRARLIGIVDGLTPPLAHHGLTVCLTLCLCHELGVGQIFRIVRLQLLVDGLSVLIHLSIQHIIQNF